MRGIERKDDFQKRRTALAGLSEEELEARFWELTDMLTEPLADLARTHTTPSIERSVLLRMGFSGMEAKAIVDGCINRSLTGKGAGHVVYRASVEKKIPVREAGLKLAAGDLWEEVAASFREEALSEEKNYDSF